VRVAIKVSFELPKGISRQRAAEFAREAIVLLASMCLAYSEVPESTVRAELIRKPKHEYDARRHQAMY
jgi:hypothetical protein